MYRAPIRALVASAPIDSVANLDHRLRFSSTNTAPITGGSAQLDRFPGPGSCPTRPAASPSLACGDRPDRQGAGRRCSKKRVAELRPVICRRIRRAGRVMWPGRPLNARRAVPSLPRNAGRKGVGLQNPPTPKPRGLAHLTLSRSLGAVVSAGTFVHLTVGLQ